VTQIAALMVLVSLTCATMTFSVAIAQTFRDVEGLGVVEGVDGSWMKLELLRERRGEPATPTTLLRVSVNIPPAMGLAGGSGVIPASEIPGVRRSIGSLVRLTEKLEQDRYRHEVDVTYKHGSVVFGIGRWGLISRPYVRAGGHEMVMDLEHLRTLDGLLVQASTHFKGR
jgi:hypothetical protein